ncbi:MAG: hypothetical protein M5U34_07200 [Chloroflexi bacterium]|nr:hypothetical protein [Chloroflexota bacterium]
MYDEAGNFIREQSGVDGYARIDLVNAVGGTEYVLQVSGNHPTVDLRICNLVENLDGIVTVHDTASADEFRYEWHEQLHYDPRHLVTINSLSYSFTLDDIREVRFYGGGGNDRGSFPVPRATRMCGCRPSRPLWSMRRASSL